MHAHGDAAGTIKGTLLCEGIRIVLALWLHAQHILHRSLTALCSAAHDMPLGRGILGAGGSSTVFESTYRGVAIALKVCIWQLTARRHSTELVPYN